jgi:hypothetical protein
VNTGARQFVVVRESICRANVGLEGDFAEKQRFRKPRCSRSSCSHAVSHTLSYHLVPLCVLRIVFVALMSAPLPTPASATARQPIHPSTARHAARRRWVCLHCSQRSDKFRLSRPWGEKGRVHIKCLAKYAAAQEEEVATAVDPVEALTPLPAAAPAALSALPVAVLPESAPSTTTASASSSFTASAPSSSSPSSSSLQQQFSVFGFARVPSSARSRALAWTIMQQSHRSTGDSIAGQVRQIALSKLKQAHSMEEEWTAVVQETAAAVGVDSAEHFVVESKLLLAPPGKGHQPVHWDTARHPSAALRYSCILYCSSGCSSTALPRFPNNDILNFSLDPAALQPVAHLLDAHSYESLPVSAGDLVFFRTSTPHYGVRNTMPQGNRVVLFGMLSPVSTPGQDAVQVFPWLWTGLAFGWDSFEFALSMVEGREHKPLPRILADEGVVAAQATIECLKKWGMFEAYHSQS